MFCLVVTSCQYWSMGCQIYCRSTRGFATRTPASLQHVSQYNCITISAGASTGRIESVGLPAPPISCPEGGAYSPAMSTTGRAHRAKNSRRQQPAPYARLSVFRREKPYLLSKVFHYPQRHVEFVFGKMSASRGVFPIDSNRHLHHLATIECDDAQILND